MSSPKMKSGTNFSIERGPHPFVRSVRSYDDNSQYSAGAFIVLFSKKPVRVFEHYTASGANVIKCLNTSARAKKTVDVFLDCLVTFRAANRATLR